MPAAQDVGCGVWGGGERGEDYNMIGLVRIGYHGSQTGEADDEWSEYD